MGGQPTKLIPKDVIDIEIDYLRRFQGCPAALKTEINEDMKAMLQSVGIAVPDDVFTAMATGKSLDPRIREEVKTILLDRLDEFKVANELGDRFYNYHLLSVVTCLLGNYWTIDRDLFKATSITRNYFRLTENLTSGQWGTVFKAKRGGAPLEFIVKVQLVSELKDLSIHEAFVALLCLNKLRAYCPNFSCIYGGFICGKPNAIDGQICTDDIDVPYTVYEAIEGQSFFSAFHKYPGLNNQPFRAISGALGMNLTPPLYPAYEMVLSGILQIYFALQIGYAKANRFAHRDLHFNNVVMRPLKESMAVRYDSKYMIYNDPIKYLQQISRPELEPKGPRKIYYVKSAYIATIIDYDSAEVWIPVAQSPGSKKLEITHFGRVDFDPIEQNLKGSEPIAKVRDFLKFLGFAAETVATSTKCSVDFKDAMLELYLTVAHPYLIMGKMPDIHGKIQLMESVRSNLYNIASQQASYIISGQITLHSFLDRFRRIMPKNYVDALLAEMDFTPGEVDVHTFIQQTPELNKVDEDVRVRLNLPILKCNGQCSTDVEIYHDLNAIDPLSEAANYQKLTAEDLIHEASSLQESRIRFARSSVSVRAVVNDKSPKTVRYQSVTQEKFDRIVDYEKEQGRKDVTAVEGIIEEKLRETRVLLDNVSVLPIPNDIFKIAGPRPLNEAAEDFKDVLVKVFKIIRNIRDSISLSNGSVMLDSTAATKRREVLLQYTQLVTAYFQNVLLPWKLKIKELADRSYFRRGTEDINRTLRSAIVEKIPDSISFSSIY